MNSVIMLKWRATRQSLTASGACTTRVEAIIDVRIPCIFVEDAVPMSLSVLNNLCIKLAAYAPCAFPPTPIWTADMHEPGVRLETREQYIFALVFAPRPSRLSCCRYGRNEVS